jgi:o-succinylbenzoate---CoA ligase
MDTSLLTSSDFWHDPQPFAASEVPNLPELTRHVLFETSGSSGNPKWVALSKQALLVSAAAVNQHLQVTRKSCWGLALPLNHVGGFSIVARAYEAGCRLEKTDRRWESTFFRDWLASAEITHTSLVPTQVHDLVKANLTAPSTLFAVVVGGGYLDPVTGQAARDLGWPVLASYGMTEAASQIATQELDLLTSLYHPAPVSLLPIWQADQTPDGLLCISGPALFSGYVRNGEFTPRITPWHVTSDRVELEDRKLTPISRADALVKVLGELVDPESIERELISLSCGLLAPGTFAVIAVPHPRAGKALVPVFESSVDSGTIESILVIYENQAAGFRKLGRRVMIGTLPRSSLGKIRRTELAAMLTQTSLT